MPGAYAYLEGVGTSMTARSAQDPMVQKAGLSWMADMYLAGKDAKTPLAAPLYAELKGLPPTLIQIADNDILRDEGEAFGRALDAVSYRGVHVHRRRADDLVDHVRAVGHVWLLRGCRMCWWNGAERPVRAVRPQS